LQAQGILRWMRAKGWQVTFIGADVDNSAHIVWIDAEMIIGSAEFADGVLGENAAGLSADEFADPGENVGPSRGVNRRIVDMTDEARQRLIVGHGTCGTSGYCEPVGRRFGFHQIEMAHDCSDPELRGAESGNFYSGQCGHRVDDVCALR
jgi:hypothetical protein